MTKRNLRRKVRNELLNIFTKQDDYDVAVPLSNQLHPHQQDKSNENSCVSSNSYTYQEESYVDFEDNVSFIQNRNEDDDCDFNDIRNTNHCELSLAEELRDFYVSANISRRVMQQLLDILNRHGIDGVPESTFLLKKSLQTYTFDQLNVNNGKFAYLGVRQNLEFLLENNLLGKLIDKTFNFSIKVNMDGVPLFKSSHTALWPILIQISGYNRPLPVAVFCGIGKPDLHLYLDKFCEELRLLKIEGMVINNIFFHLTDIIVIADAPARAFVQGILGHNAFLGCGWCRQVGVTISQRTTFSAERGETRTDTDYDNFCENNQLYHSPLIGIVPLYSHVVPDYMHIACLGVMRKLMKCYFTRIKNIPLSCRLSTHHIESINAAIIKFRQFTPREFQRKPRTLHELVHFKASELRTFFLYLGPYCFKESFTTSVYNHFLLFHFAMYIFCSSNCIILHKQATVCLENFVAQVPHLFSPEIMSYNFHALLHLSEFVLSCGSCDNFSTFAFENLLGIIKRRTRSNNGIFIQSVNNLIKIRALYTDNGVGSLFFSKKSPNNCAITSNGEVILISNCIENNVSGRILSFSHDLYDYPYSSHCLKIGYYRLSREFVRNIVPVNKAIMIPSGNEFLIIPFVK
jgi:hypothetical protein